MRSRASLVLTAFGSAVACSEGVTLEQAHPKLELPLQVLDFGPIAEGTTVRRAVPISNVGPVSLTVQLRLADGAPPDFALAILTATVASGTTRDLPVIYAPAGPGSDAAELLLRTDDPERPDARIALRGGPIAPALEISPDPVDFGPITGATSVRPIGLRNTGLAILHLTDVRIDADANPDFALRTAPATTTLAPATEVEIVVDYTRSARASAGRLLVRSDDPAAAEREVRLLPDPYAVCADGADNDTDGLTDFPDDPGCTSATDGDEANPPECTDGATMSCGTDAGECDFGARTCSNSLWGPCVQPRGPTAEACNGLDDDCDTRTDEEVSEACTIHGCGGARACVEGTTGTWTACIPVGGTTEQCNGLDDDCDGTIDDGVVESCAVNGCTGQRVCVPGGGGQFTACQVMTSAEICNGMDDDCDGNTDEDLADLSCGMGACARTVAACTAGMSGMCTPGTPGVETCNTVDDDCDGTPDDLAPLTCGMGACARTVPACSGGAANTCSPGTPGIEQCNGIDDDCDGTPDDLPPLACGMGMCARTAVACTAGVPGTCTPGTPGSETCNTLDDDCDGTPDDLPPLTCGMGTCARTVAACTAGVPATCTPGMPGTEVCNGLDDDCDGVPDDGACTACGLMSTAPDPQEPNNAAGAARPVVPWSTNGTHTRTYDLTLPALDSDWLQFDFPPIGAATFAEMTAEILCVSWAAAGCPGAPTVGLEAWYVDDFSSQQDGAHNGLSGNALVTSSGPVASFLSLNQRFRVRAYPSSSVCAGEAANARLRVTVTWSP